MTFKLGSRSKGFAAEHVANLGILQFKAIPLGATEQIAGEFEIFVLACRAVELNQSHLQFGMASDEGSLGGTEVVNYVVSKSDASIEQRAAAGGAVVGNSGLNQMTQAIIFM